MTGRPAGDNAAQRGNFGYLFGQSRRLRNACDGRASTGGGFPTAAALRPEATGYGLCYFTQEALRCMRQDSFEGKTVVISGSGNVAIYATEKAVQLGGRVVALSDSERLYLRQRRREAGRGESPSLHAARASASM